MRIAIIGTGAMGSLFAAYLAPHTDLIVLGTWQEGVRALDQHGVWLERDGSHFKIPVHASSHLRSVEPVELALVAVKGRQTERAAQWAKQILKPDGVALTLQNGLGNLEILAAQVGAERAALGVTSQGATLLGPAHVRHAGQGDTVLAATPTTRRSLERFAGVLTRAGISTRVTRDVAGQAWGKLVVNSAINALTAIYRVPNGALVENPDTHALMRAAAVETAQVAHALGVHLPFADPAARAEQVARATATNQSSTLQDVLRGAPTELERINGAVVREGKRLGIPTPVNEQLLRVATHPRLAYHQPALG